MNFFSVDFSDFPSKLTILLSWVGLSKAYSSKLGYFGLKFKTHVWCEKGVMVHLYDARGHDSGFGNMYAMLN